MEVHITTAHTVNDADAGRPLAVFHEDLSTGGADRIVEAFELEPGIDFLEASVAILFQGRGVHDVETGGQDDGTDLHLDLLLLRRMIHRQPLADPHTLHAFRAGTTVQTAQGLGC